MHTREQPQAVIRNFLLRMEQFMHRHYLVRPGAHIVLAVSGGADSMAMLDAFCRLQEKWRLTLTVAHVNFGLRGEASDGDERFVRRAAKKYGLPVIVKRAETRRIARERKISIQLAAREIRYEFFAGYALDAGAPAVAIAHNAGDNAETMLFNFFRGSGIEGLKGIPVSAPLTRGSEGQVRIIRPLLFIGRGGIESYMKACRIRHREDASNSTIDYSRNFIRRKIIPAVEERINPSLLRTLNAESEIFTSLTGFIGGAVEEAASRCISRSREAFSLSVHLMLQEPLFIQQMLVKRCFEMLGIEPDFVHIEEIIRLLTGGTGKTVDCGGGYSARRTRSAIEIGKSAAAEPFLLAADAEQKVGTPGFTFQIRACGIPGKFNGSGLVEYIDAAAVRLPLTIRPWKPGDSFMPLGMKAAKKLSDFFTDQKVPRHEKARIPIVLSGNTIVWVAGMRLDERFKVTPETRSVYQLSIQFHH